MSSSEIMSGTEQKLNTVTSPHPFYQLIKRVFDILFSLVLLAVLFIPLCIIAAMIMTVDGMHPFYTQERFKKDGKTFRIIKFRSMPENSEDPASSLTAEQLTRYYTEYKLENDPRVTAFGRFLRESSLDELPQLYNILTGDMSFVGPRPVVKRELEFYGNQTAKLLSVQPGLTGYWQAFARNKARYETGERQAMEMYYIDHRGILTDLKILFRTVRTVLSREGAE